MSVRAEISTASNESMSPPATIVDGKSFSESDAEQESRDKEKKLGIAVSYKDLAVRLHEDIKAGQISDVPRPLEGEQAPLSKVHAEDMLSELGLSTYITLKLEPKGSLKLNPRRSLSEKEIEKRRGVIGYKWQNISSWEEEGRSVIVADRLEEYITNATRAVQELVESNLDLVEYPRWKGVRKGLEVDDSHQEGMLGLVEAANRFDWRKEYPFRPFASTTINGEISHAVRDKKPITKVPREIYVAYKQVVSARDSLREEWGEFPPYKAVAEKSGIDETTVREVLIFDAQKSLSLDRPDHLDPDVSLGSLIVDHEQKSVEEAGIQRVLIEQVWRTLAESTIPDRTKRILVDYYINNKTQSMIARALGYRQMHISRLLRQGLEEWGNLVTADPEDRDKINGEIAERNAFLNKTPKPKEEVQEKEAKKNKIFMHRIPVASLEAACEELALSETERAIIENLHGGVSNRDTAKQFEVKEWHVRSVRGKVLAHLARQKTN